MVDGPAWLGPSPKILGRTWTKPRQQQTKTTTKVIGSDKTDVMSRGARFRGRVCFASTSTRQTGACFVAAPGQLKGADSTISLELAKIVV